jgi:hypothetical protein
MYYIHNCNKCLVVGRVFLLQVDPQVVYKLKKVKQASCTARDKAGERKGLPDMSEGFGIEGCAGYLPHQADIFGFLNY